MLQSMVFSASLPISAMVSPVRKNESTNDEYTHLPLSVSETRERNERCIKLERDTRDSPTHTQSAEQQKQEQPKKKTKKKKTHQTPHAADDKPVGNPGGDRTDADESRERRSRIRSSHDGVFFLLLKIVFTTVRPFPIEISPLFKTI